MYVAYIPSYGFGGTEAVVLRREGNAGDPVVQRIHIIVLENRW